MEIGDRSRDLKLCIEKRHFSLEQNIRRNGLQNLTDQILTLVLIAHALQQFRRPIFLTMKFTNL